MKLAAIIFIAFMYIAIEVVTTFKLVDGVYYNCMYHKTICKQALPKGDSNDY